MSCMAVRCPICESSEITTFEDVGQLPRTPASSKRDGLDTEEGLMTSHLVIPDVHAKCQVPHMRGLAR